MTAATLRVVSALAADPAGQHYGYALLQQTGLPSGTLYPILERLEAAGWVVGRWAAPGGGGRPPRRYYRLTALGRREAERAAATLRITPSGRVRPRS